jgi:hypothetical protein
MSQITRRGILLGSVAITVTSSGLVIMANPANAFSLKGLANAARNIGAAVVHGATAVVQGAQHVMQVAPQLITDAANAAATVVGSVAPIASQLITLEQQVTQSASQVLQQIPIFCNPNATNNPLAIISGISSQPLSLGGIAQQAVMQDPTQYMMSNAQSLASHLITYLLQGQPTNVSVPAASTTVAGTTPTFAAAGIPFLGNQNQTGVFPTLLALNGADIAAGGDGLLSLFALA